MYPIFVPKDPIELKEITQAIIEEAGEDPHGSSGAAGAIREVVKNVMHGCNGLVTTWFEGDRYHVFTVNGLNHADDDTSNGYGTVLIKDCAEEYTCDIGERIATAHLVLRV